MKLVTENDFTTYFNSLDELKEPDEIFQPLEGYSEYLISNYGKLVSLKAVPGKYKIMKPDTYKDKYPDVKIIDKKVRKHIILHIQVAKQFIPIPENFRKKGYNEEKLEVNHIDGNKYNCHVSNLEWITPKVNKIFGGKYQKDKLDANSISIFAPDGSYIHSFTSIQRALEFFNIDNSEIRTEIYNALNSPDDTVLGLRWITYDKKHNINFNLLRDDPRYADENEAEYDYDNKHRPIYQIDILTDKIIAKYNSLFEASVHFKGLTGQTNTIGRIGAFHDGNYSIAYGFKWIYVDIYDYYHQQN